ncbi:molybdenum cofactor guanylyltransferase [Halonotius roseus]|uniref:Probable molybdenum cofactor guanylyltransferase n=1 Tax=Halonotius roseus TaxID=2511997 RepID=A0A544QMQ8_9EURY|nr:molybdenum cofactor guanylyltransferase [Halonotius roseus]TQQ80211.1 molybdenum cofactor guanylyltransferase [Halonotius roseus]
MSLTDNESAAETLPAEETAAHADTGRAGLILAGGRSERFPTIDKALAPLDGRPLLGHVADALAPVVDERVINCRRDQQAAFAEAVGDDPRFAIDPVGDRGPLSGLRTALAATEATYAAVVPCDMPFVPAGFIEYLFGQARHNTGAIPRVDGRQRSLPAVVHVRAAAAACEDARRHDEGLAAFVSALDPVVVPERAVTAHVGSAAFANIDTHEDLAAVRGEGRRFEG